MKCDRCTEKAIVRVYCRFRERKIALRYIFCADCVLDVRKKQSGNIVVWEQSTL